MTNRKQKLGAVIIMLMLCAIVAGPVWGQRRGFRPAANSAQSTPDPLGFLKQALTKAGAAALGSDQETALTTLITNFRSANQPGAPDAAEQAAREAYVNAILAATSPTDANAKAAADSLAASQATRQRTMLEAEAGFQIQALSILHSDQVAALENSVGKNGIVRVLQSLGGPGPGMGRGMMGGRGAAPQMRPPE